MAFKKMPLTNKIMILVGILVILIGLFGLLNKSKEPMVEGKVVFKDGQGVIGEITLEEVKRLPAVKKKVAISSTGGLTKHEFTVTPLLEVFNTLDPEITQKYKRVIPRGVDDYGSVYSMEEVLAKNNVYLAYADNGRPLMSKDGKSETMRIVSLEDQFGQRFTNYLVEMRLE